MQIQIHVILLTYCSSCSWLISLPFHIKGHFKKSRSQQFCLCVIVCHWFWDWTSLNFENSRRNIKFHPIKVFASAVSALDCCMLLLQQLTETKTQWLTRGPGGRQVLHLLPPPPPTHPHCWSLIRPHHQLHKTNTYESQQERIHKSGCSSIQIMLLFLFQEPLWRFFLSPLRVSCLNHNCFVMESKLDPWVELWITLIFLRWTCCCCSRVVFELDMQSRLKFLPHKGKNLESSDGLIIDTFL